MLKAWMSEALMLKALLIVQARPEARREPGCGESGT